MSHTCMYLYLKITEAAITEEKLNDVNLSA